MTREKYIEHEVLSAPPQKLQLLLLEGAIRNAARAKQVWVENWAEAGEAIIRAQEIVAQLLAGLSPDRRPPLVRRVAGIYTFIFRSLAVAHLQKNQKSLDEAIRILEIERETWRQMCETLGSTFAMAGPHFSGRPMVAETPTAGVSFEA